MTKLNQQFELLSSMVVEVLEMLELHCRLSLRESCAAFAERKATLGLLFLVLACSATAHAQIEVQAVVGEPFGVGRGHAQSAGGNAAGTARHRRRRLERKVGPRVLPGHADACDGECAQGNARRRRPLTNTPLLNGGPVRQQVGGILRGVLSRPPRTTIYFLFRGREPLNLIVQARTSIPLDRATAQCPGVYRRLMDAWWRDYAAPRRLLAQKPDYPPQVETYLVNTLARRLNLAVPRDRQEESGL